MTNGSDEWTRSRFDDLDHRLELLSIAVYGDRKTPPNGGGVYGEIRRMREENKSSAQNRQDQIRGIEEQIKRLDERIDAMDKRLRPRWWDYVIMGGAVVLAAVLLLQVLTILGHIG